VGLTPRAQSPARAEGESSVAVARRADIRGPPDRHGSGKAAHEPAAESRVHGVGHCVELSGG
jgi:hypothetical protein